MKFVQDFIAEHKVRQLRNATSLKPEALKRLEDDLVSMGVGAIPALTECLGHGTARPPALVILQRLLSDDTLHAFVRALASPNSAVVSGIKKVLGTGRSYDPTQLLPLLRESSVPRSLIESVLTERAADLPPDQVLGVLILSREAQVVLFRLLERTLNERVAPRLIPMLRNDDPWIRTTVAHLLSRYPSEDAERGLRLCLRDENRGVRLEAVHALRAMAARGSLPDLVLCLRDSDLKVQSAAIDVICELGDPGCVPLLLTVLTDEAETARRAAVEVLNALATPEAVQDLVRALRDQDWWVRVRAADALGTLGGEKVVQAVVGLLDESDDFIRRHAVEILNAVPNQGAVPALLRAVDDTDWWVRERAIDALGKTGDPRAVEALLALLRRESSAQPLCIRALGRLGDASALDPLIGMLTADKEELRNEALGALQAFPDAQLSSQERTTLKDAIARAARPSGAGHPSPPRLHPKGGGIPPLDGQAQPSPMHSSLPPLPPLARSMAPLNFSELEPDTVLLDRYRVIKKIGRGGFGAVYLCEDRAIQDELILKILNPQLSQDKTIIPRFIQELKLTRRITHRNVIRIFDFLDLGGAHAVSMEYFPGRDLGKMLVRGSTFDTRRGLAIAAQICEGLGAAHAEGVVHRDIKPANILIDASDQTKIVDFGLASAQQDAGSRLTKSGLLIGTPEYMAPEQIVGESVDHRADLYSLGVMLYEMFSGTRPFAAETPVKVLFLHLEGEVVPLSTQVPGLPAPVGAVVDRAMARGVGERPASAEEMREQILSALSALEAA